MIDPHDVTNFARTDAELQEFFMFCVSVAGKKASMMAVKLEAFLSGRNPSETPFSYVARLARDGRLEARLREVRTGKYDVLTRAWSHAALDPAFDLRRLTPAEMQRVHGIGFKTSRYFILHSRETANVAVIDTHILKYIAHRGYKVPKSVPTGRTYLRLETMMLGFAAAAGMSMADFDLRIWSHYASKGRDPLPDAVPLATARAA